jgi:TrmH family RNA methyltransferase
VSGIQPAALIARVQAATTRAGRVRTGEFSLEGTRLLERALRAGVSLTAVLHSQDYGSTPREGAVLQELERRNLPLARLAEEAMSTLIGGRTFGGILALARKPETEDPPSPERHLLVAVDVQDPGNLGALVRTAAAAGVGAVLCVGTSDAYHPKAVRTSMGALFKTHVIELEERPALWELLAGSGHTTLGSTPKGGVEPWSATLTRAPSALLVGSEAFGLDEETLARCQHRVTLPQSDALDSYSVNAAAAMLLYELGRRDTQSHTPR